MNYIPIFIMLRNSKLESHKWLCSRISISRMNEFSFDPSSKKKNFLFSLTYVSIISYHIISQTVYYLFQVLQP